MPTSGTPFTGAPPTGTGFGGGYFGSSPGPDPGSTGVGGTAYYNTPPQNTVYGGNNYGAPDYVNTNPYSASPANDIWQGGFQNPGTPDAVYNGVDITQLQQSQNSANRGNAVNPFGSNTQTFDPATQQWTSTQTLSGPGSAEYNEANVLAGGLSGMSQGLDTSQLTPWGTAPSYSGATAQQGAADAYGAAKANLDPQWNQQQTQLKGQLAAQGLHPGDPAYDQQMNSFQQQKTSAYQQANLGAFQTGANEAATQTGAEATAASATDQQRMQQIQQQLTQAGWTTNEINQLLGGPAVSGAPGVQNANATQTNNNVQSAFTGMGQQQQQQQSGLNNLISGGASAAALAALALA